MSSKSNVRNRFQGLRSGLSVFFKKLSTRISNLFEPEEVEVEVTFKVKGKKTTYTYTEVEHKQVA